MNFEGETKRKKEKKTGRLSRLVVKTILGRMDTTCSKARSQEIKSSFILDG